MPKCGCNTGTPSISIQTDPPLTSVGSGDPETPIELGIEHDGKTGCAGVTACVGDNLGPGLTYDPATGHLMAKISADAGNAASISGNDQGITVACPDCEDPGPAACNQKTIASIAAVDPCTLLIGAERQAGLRNPFSAPYATDHCLDLGVDIIHIKAQHSADGIAFAYDWTSATTLTQHNNINLPSAYDTSSDTLSSTVQYAGDPTDSETSSSTNPVVGGALPGGYWGWHRPQFTMPRIGELLDRVAGHAVVILDANQINSTRELECAEACAQAIRRTCRQSSVMVGVAVLGSADALIAQGITVCMWDASTPAWGDQTPPWTAEDLTSRGIEWAVIHRNYADSVFAAFRDAGINVFARGVERIYERKRFECVDSTPALARGYFSHDPQYTAELPGHIRSFDVITRSHELLPGLLSFETSRSVVTELNQLAYRGVWGRMSRGVCPQDPPGLLVHKGFGGGQDRPGVLYGGMCQHLKKNLDPTSYNLSWEQRIVDPPAVGSGSSYPMMAVLFGGAEDWDCYEWTYAPFSGYENPQPRFYRAYVRNNGLIGLGMWDLPIQPSGRLDFYYIRDDIKTDDRSQTELQVPIPTPGTWYGCQLTVTPTTITFTYTSGGTNYAVSANNSQYRGPNWWATKREYVQTDTNQPWDDVKDGLMFSGQFRSFSYS